jgi:hypothetical protein
LLRLLRKIGFVARIIPQFVKVSVNRHDPIIIVAYADRGDADAAPVHTRFDLGSDPAVRSDVVFCQRSVNLTRNDLLDD